MKSRQWPFSVPWQLFPDVGRAEEKRKGKKAEGGGEEKQASEKEKKKEKGLEKEEGVSGPETSYLRCFASISMAVTLAPGTSSFPDTQSWCFNGNNELIE